MKKTLSFLAVFAMSLGIFIAPLSSQAEVSSCEDADGDGYYAASETFDPDEKCKNKMGYEEGDYEPALCDCKTIKGGKDAKASGCPDGFDEESADIESIMNTGKVTKTLKGRNLNPGATDAPNDLIDQNCDGADGKYIEGAAGERSLDDFIQQAISILGQIVVGISVMILIWGGIMYSTAAGEEEKTKKARKAIVGALIGLVVGILAWQIVGMVIDQVQ